MSQEALTEFRQRYPQYRDLTDGDLAQKLIAKYPQYRDLLGDVATSPAASRTYTWGETIQGAIESFAPPALATVGGVGGAVLGGAAGGNGAVPGGITGGGGGGMGGG